MKTLRTGVLLTGVLASLAATVAAPPLEAQRAPPRNGLSGLGLFMVGWHALDLDELNAALRAAGYPAFQEDHFSAGGGLYRIRNRVLLGVEGHGVGVPSRTTADDRFRTRLMHGYGQFSLGYALAQGPRFDVFPMVGIGVSGTTLQVLDRSSPSFDDVLADPGRSTQLTAGALLLDASLGVSYRATGGPRRTGSGGLALGLRGGYTFAPVAGEWRTLSGNDVAGGPDAGVEGFYVKALVGGWSQRRAGRRR